MQIPAEVELPFAHPAEVGALCSEMGMSRDSQDEVHGDLGVAALWRARGCHRHPEHPLLRAPTSPETPRELVLGAGRDPADLAVLGQISTPSSDFWQPPFPLLLVK